MLSTSSVPAGPLTSHSPACFARSFICILLIAALPACSLLESFQRVGKAHKAQFACCLAGSSAASGASLAHLWDHQVSGRPVFPGAAYFEMAAAAAGVLAAAGSGGSNTDAALADVSIVAPLLLPLPGSSGSGAVVLQASYSPADGAMAVQSVQAGGRGRPTEHVEGHAVFVAASQPRGSKAAALPSPQRQRMGPGRRLLATAMQQRQAAAFAELACSSHDDSAVNVSPAVMDCCLQLAAVPAGGASKLRIPAGVGLLLLGSRAEPPPGSCHGGSSGFLALARPSAELAPGNDSDATYTDYCLASGSSGLAVCRITEMEARPMGSTAARRKPVRRLVPAAGGAADGKLRQDEWLYSLEWLTHGSGGSAAAASAASTAAAGGMQLDLSAGGHAGAAAGAIAVGQQAMAGNLQYVALLTRGAALPAAAGSPAASSGSASRGMVQAAGLWACARTMAQELSTFTVQAVDLQQQASAKGPAAALLAAPASSAPALLPSAAQLDSSPYGYAVQGGSLVAASLQHSAVKPMLSAFQLFPQPRGALQSLVPLPLDVSSVAPGQVLVAVKAVGINFRDVLNVLGMYPGDPGAPGGDCAGVVVAAGAGVSHLRPGDAVFGLAGGSLGSHVHVDARMLTQVTMGHLFSVYCLAQHKQRAAGTQHA